MAKNKIIFLFFLVLFNVILAKPKQDKFIVYFKDKPVDKNVERLFSKEAVEYRKKFNIPVDERDFPVDVNYIEQLKNERATIINTSNWLNASLISIDIKMVKFFSRDWLIALEDSIRAEFYLPLLTKFPMIISVIILSQSA